MRRTPKDAAELARDWAKKGREKLNGKKSRRRDEVSDAVARLCTLIQARGFEAIARALDVLGETEVTQPVLFVCPNCEHLFPPPPEE